MAKAIIAYSLYYSGSLSLYKRLYFKDKIIALMYHRVLPVTEQSKTYTHPAIIVNTSTFEKHINFLNKKFSVVSVNELAEHLVSKIPFNNNQCIITFDDGWIDNYLYAFPVLKKYNTTAVIFLAANYIESDKTFWPEYLGNLVFTAYKNKDNLHALLERYRLEILLEATATDARQIVSDFVHRLRGKSEEHINEVIEDFCKELHNIGLTALSNETDRFMSWSQINEMQANNIYFSSHTLNHRKLTTIPSNELEVELEQSRNTIETMTNTKVESFAYPNGDYNLEIRNKVENCNYKIAFSTKGGHITVNDDRYTLCRMNMNEAGTMNIPMFYCRLLGIM